MTLFNEREQAFEQMFVHDEEARFRALAKRNRLLGQWAATQIGLTGERADAYANEIGKSVVAAVVDESLVERIQADFASHGVAESEEGIREKMAELMTFAVAAVRSTTW
ncbi:DUF1476 domain-containing protein [Microvirga subterranea]|uniref:DUF1476 domain-containing protein n=1 Tax=Microvirga subterranea TaxID=186651 RepID=A0A370HHX8_9HYPH|nr:DUF1476 domain-containing protein [Microvirga subterranea]RDI57242.1 hypothetical protein DES45_107159 [Microvirga subterranea]